MVQVRVYMGWYRLRFGMAYDLETFCQIFKVQKLSPTTT